MNDNGVIQCNSCNGTGVVRKNDWIKCTDRMPPDMEPVIVTVDDKYYPSTKYSWIGRKNGNFWEILVGMSDTGDVYMGIGNPGNELTNVTHWMPMPEPAED